MVTIDVLVRPSREILNAPGRDCADTIQYYNIIVISTFSKIDAKKRNDSPREAPAATKKGM